MSQEETTGSWCRNGSAAHLVFARAARLTRVVSEDRSLQDLLHPSPDGDLLGRSEVVRALLLVHQLEGELARADVRIADDAITRQVDNALGPLLLQGTRQSMNCGRVALLYALLRS